MRSRKIAIVTGGNRGIGREIARQLGQAGLEVVVGARHPAKCAATAYALDVDDCDSVRAFVATVAQRHGPPAVLVNNAGVLREAWGARVEGTDLSAWRETFETNLFGAVRMCREVLPHMKRVGYGRIVNVSSGLGQIAQMGPGTPAYRASKAALNALTLTLAAEAEGSGILVNSMSPGWVRTDMGGSNAPRSVEEGAETAVWLCLLPDDGPTGRFFRDRQPIPW